MDIQSPKPRWWTRLLHRPGWLIALAVCLLLSAVLVPFGWRYYRTQLLVAEIEMCGGIEVGFEPGGPRWLRSIVGDEWMKPFDIPNRLHCYRVDTISAGGGEVPHLSTNISDLEFLIFIVPLDRLHGWKSIAISDFELTHESLEAFSDFDDLEEVAMGGKAFDDAALAYFSKAYKLRVLYLSGTSISDEGLKHLQGLKNLESLSLSNTDVTDEGVSELQRHLPGLDVSDD